MNTIINKKNLLCIIVTFNPDDSLINNLKIYEKIFNSIFIVDNCSTNNFFEKFKINLFSNTKIKIKYLNKNYGIAKALNVGIEYAISNNFNWVNTFDQDSIPVTNLLDYYNLAINKFNGNNFIIGVNYSNENILNVYQDINIKESKSIITSGCLYPVSIFDKVGFFNEKLFIDGVDFDFNLRVLINQFKIYKIQEPMIKHNIGAEISRNLFFLHIFSSNHNEIRRYFIGRNHVFLTLKYFNKFPIWILKKNLFFVFSVIKIIIVEDQIILKLKYLLKGLSNGYNFYLENKFDKK